MSLSFRPLDPTDCARAAEIYWNAFETKLGRILRPKPKALAFLGCAIQPASGIAAYNEENELLGIVGYKTAESAFVQASFAQVAEIYGQLGAAWRAPLLSLFERQPENGQLLLDGICVAAQARGQGIGSRLLDCVVDEACRRNLQSIRLDVIDTNAKARALYERKGFTQVATDSAGLFAPIVGFASYATMLRHV